jgi:hypothetical protein
MRVSLSIERITKDARHHVLHVRCIHGPVRIGDRFTIVYTVKLNPDYSTTETIISTIIDLKVERLVTYGKSMESIDEGLTLSAWVSGDGAENLMPGQYVSNDHRSITRPMN